MSFKKEFKSAWSSLTWVGRPLIALWCIGYAIAALSLAADKVLPKMGSWLHRLIFR